MFCEDNFVAIHQKTQSCTLEKTTFFKDNMTFFLCTSMSVFYEHNHRATCSPIGWFSILGTAGLHLTPCCSVPKPKPAIESASSSSRLRQQAASFMAVLSGGQASLSTRPIADSSKHSTVKRPAVDREPPPLHSSTPTSAFPLYISLIYSLSPTLSFSLSLLLLLFLFIAVN